MKQMYILVGEREQSSEFTIEEARLLEDAWNQAPIWPMLCLRAFKAGRSRKLLNEVYDLGPKYIAVNLLAPNPLKKRWDKKAARHNASVLVRFCRHHFPPVNFILLGRRVSHAFLVPQSKPFGSVVRTLGCNCLLLPNPSMRTPYLRDDEKQDMVRGWVKWFVNGA